MNQFTKYKTLVKTIFTSTFLIFLIFGTSTSSERLDAIAAIVGDSAILVSEVDAYTILKVNQFGLKPDSFELSLLRQKSLDEMIEGKVLLVHAEKDTNIKITNSEIESEVANRVNYILKQNNISLKEMEDILNKQQGITLARFKNEIRMQIRQEIIKQKVQQLYIPVSRLNKSDIENFYNEYKDSIPDLGESILLSKLFLNITPSTSLREKAYKKILSLKELLSNGEPFDKIASQYSEGPTASQGGDLGFIEKGSLQDMTFEDKVFSLKLKEISDPFETKRGFQIVTITERKGLQVHAKEILISTAVPDQEVMAKMNLLDSIRNSIKSSTAFSNAVRSLSQDEVTRARNGLMPWISVSQLDHAIRSGFDSLSVGTISRVVKDGSGVALYRIEKIVPFRKISIDDDWNEIVQIAQRLNMQKRLIELVTRWKKETFIDKRL